jgi:hypothetical protein
MMRHYVPHMDLMALVSQTMKRKAGAKPVVFFEFILPDDPSTSVIKAFEDPPASRIRPSKTL